MDEISLQLEFLSATLPSRASDQESGRRKFAVYSQALSGFTLEALKHMSRRCIAELKWFPVPSECIAFARSWSGMETLCNRVNRKISEYAERSFERFIAQLSLPVNQDWLDAQPEQWRRIAVERGHLRWLEGKMVQRVVAVKQVEGGAA